MTRDRNFVVDTLASRGMPQIVVCCGAGHAYKSVPRQRSFSYSIKRTITYDSGSACSAATTLAQLTRLLPKLISDMFRGLSYHTATCLDGSARAEQTH